MQNLFNSKPTAGLATGLSCLGIVAAFLLFASAAVPASAGDRLHLVDGTEIEVDAAWEDSEGIWYRRGGVTQLLNRARVRRIARDPAEHSVVRNPSDVTAKLQSSATEASTTSPPSSESTAVSAAESGEQLWIYLVGGAKVLAQDLVENSDGVWYRRNNLNIFIERARVERVGRDETISSAFPGAAVRTGWTSGNKRLDALIMQSGARYNVDPYLIFCVMEQESHFNARALSPKGARGLMQLMPATAARFGVRDASNPAQNIAGGTRYLKQLLGMFGGRVDLALASYNAGEGAVLKYGRRIPPYRETRNYVHRISKKYRRDEFALHRVSKALPANPKPENAKQR